MQRKKQIGLAILTLLLVSCNNGNNNSLNNGPQPGENDYVATVKYPDGSPVTGDVYVQWCTSTSCSMSVKVNDQGVAFTSDLTDQQYYVHVTNVPSGYAYNPNGYPVDADNKVTTITLSTITAYTEGDGSKYAEGTDLGPYVVSEGVYDVILTKDDSYKYFAFKPSHPGKYLIESWDSSKDPKLEVFGNNVSFIPDEPIEDGVYDNVSDVNYNFKMELDIASKDYGAENSGYTIVLGVTVNDSNKNAQFPLNIECIEQYDFYTNDGNQGGANVVTAKEVPSVYTRPENVRIAVLELDGSEVAYYNEEDGFYHLNSSDGPVLMANISKSNDKWLSESLTDKQNGEGGARAFIIDGQNYNQFLDAYEKVVNEDGLCPVTKELKDFLSLFMQKDLDGILSYFHMTYNENSWMACCSYYVDLFSTLTGNVISLNGKYTYGELVGLYTVDASSKKAITIKNNNNAYGYTIECLSDDGRITYNDVEYSASKYIDSTASDVNFELSSSTNNNALRIKVYIGNGLIQKSSLGLNNLDVNSDHQEIVFIASQEGTYSFEISQGSDVSFEYQDTIINAKNDGLSYRVTLEENEVFIYKLYSNQTTSQDTKVNLTIKYLKELILGCNSVTFAESGLIDGVDLEITGDASKDVEYVLSVDKANATVIALKIDNVVYQPNSYGYITSLTIKAGTSVVIHADTSEFFETIIDLYVDPLAKTTSIGDNDLFLSSDDATTGYGLCVTFKAPSNGTYSISTASLLNDFGATIRCNGEISLAVTSPSTIVSINNIQLKTNDVIVIYINYETINASSTAAFEGMNVTLTINRI